MQAHSGHGQSAATHVQPATEGGLLFQVQAYGDSIRTTTSYCSSVPPGTTVSECGSSMHAAT